MKTVPSVRRRKLASGRGLVAKTANVIHISFFTHFRGMAFDSFDACSSPSRPAPMERLGPPSPPLFFCLFPTRIVVYGPRQSTDGGYRRLFFFIFVYARWYTKTLPSSSLLMRNSSSR